MGAASSLGLAGVALVVWHKIDIREVTPAASPRTLIALAGVTAATLYQSTFCAERGPQGRRGGAVRRVARGPRAAGRGSGRLPRALERGSSSPPIAFLVIFASFLAVSALHVLMRHGEATRVTSMMYLPPIFAVVLEAAMFGVRAERRWRSPASRSPAPAWR